MDLNRKREDGAEGDIESEGGDKVAVLYANVSPLHKPHCTTDRDDDREGGEVRERLVCSAMGQWKEGGREEEGRRPFKDPHYLNVAKTLP